MIDLLQSWFGAGGAMMWILLALGVALYAALGAKLFALADASRTDHEDGFGLLRALIGAAPLLGLLGTVNGIILSFDGIVDGGAVEQMSSGIGHALRTTQYGLAISAPALLVERIAARWARRRALEVQSA